MSRCDFLSCSEIAEPWREWGAGTHECDNSKNLAHASPCSVLPLSSCFYEGQTARRLK